MLNVEQIKASFPVFEKHPDLVFLDNAATTQKPEVVLAAMDNFYRESNSNIHRGVYSLAENADKIYEQGRKAVADFIGASSDQIIFTKNSTEAANLLAFGIGESMIESGDNVVVTELEHHANYLPWQETARRKGCEFRVWSLLDVLSADFSSNPVDKNTKVLAITQMSNVLGVQPDLKKIIDLAHAQGAIVVVDASQSVAHMPLDVSSLGADAVFFTGHKLFGPMGIGVLYMKDEIASRIPPMLTGGGMVKELPDLWQDSPPKFEAGTPHVAGVAGLSAAIDFVREIGLTNIKKHETSLITECKRQLASISEVKVWGMDLDTSHSSILSFEIEGVHPHDIASVLAEDNVCIRAGHHCAKPLMKCMNAQAVARASFSVYNSLSDVQSLTLGVQKALNTFK